MSEPIHVISLGAGVQSSTMALMATENQITPRPVAAVFSDTQQEPPSVYTWLEWLEQQLPFPTMHVSFGDLGKTLECRINQKTGVPYWSSKIPAFIKKPNGKRGILIRKCTTDYKLTPLLQARRTLIGRDALTRWRRVHKAALTAMRRAEENEETRPQWAWDECQADPLVIVWIGISLDEAHRMKPPMAAWENNRYPLVDMQFTRADCLDWMQRHGYPEPPRSACIFCPFHSDEEWLRLKEQEPESFAAAVVFEKRLQALAPKMNIKEGVPYLHDSLVPLDQVQFQITRGAERMGNECEGMCGV